VSVSRGRGKETQPVARRTLFVKPRVVLRRNESGRKGEGSVQRRPPLGRSTSAMQITLLYFLVEHLRGETNGAAGAKKKFSDGA
jgi:hypothetical protein